MAVAKGQSEAGLSLGFRRSALLRLIVIPQAIRVMLPPMGNQYLNLAKILHWYSCSFSRNCCCWSNFIQPGRTNFTCVYCMDDLLQYRKFDNF